jgi:hypothetical protein
MANPHLVLCPNGQHDPVIDMYAELPEDVDRIGIQSVCCRQEGGAESSWQLPVDPIAGAPPTRPPHTIPTAADDAIVRAEDSGIARVGRIDRSHLGPISFGVVGPTRARR